MRTSASLDAWIEGGGGVSSDSESGMISSVFFRRVDERAVDATGEDVGGGKGVEGVLVLKVAVFVTFFSTFVRLGSRFRSGTSEVRRRLFPVEVLGMTSSTTSTSDETGEGVRTLAGLLFFFFLDPPIPRVSLYRRTVARAAYEEAQF